MESSSCEPDSAEPLASCTKCPHQTLQATVRRMKNSGIGRAAENVVWELSVYLKKICLRQIYICLRCRFGEMSRMTMFIACNALARVSNFYVSSKVFIHQILAVVLPQSGNGTGAGFPQQAKTEAAVNMHPDLFLC